MQCPTCDRAHLDDYEDPNDQGAALVKCTAKKCGAVFSVLLERVL